MSLGAEWDVGIACIEAANPLSGEESLEVEEELAPSRLMRTGGRTCICGTGCASWVGSLSFIVRSERRGAFRFGPESKAPTGFGGSEGCRGTFALDLGGDTDEEEWFGAKDDSEDILDPIAVAAPDS